MARVLRSEVVQGILDLFPEPAYLEIGVSQGITFDAVRARRKVAVDPAFQFDVAVAAAQNPNAEYHPVTSDRFFGGIVAADERFELIYLDGLHTLEQTLRDFTNALHFLRPGGVIVVDDVYPNSYVASLRSISEFRAMRKALKIAAKSWMGDTYRLVYFIDSFHQQLTFRTVGDNHGQLVVWEARRPEVRERTVEEVGRYPYEKTVLNKAVLRFAPFGEILAELRERVRPA